MDTTDASVTQPSNNNRNVSNKLLHKQCRVCGDMALCFNFDGLSCEACKVFFRRSMVLNLQFKCKKQNSSGLISGEKCIIDKSNRKKCKKCRLDKCFEIGMKKELITNFNSNENSANSANTTNNSKSIPSSQNQNPQSLKQSLLSSASSASSSPSIKQEDEPESPEEITLPKTVSDSMELQPYDLYRIHEIRNAMTVFRNETTMDLIGTSSDLVQVINLLEYHVRKTVKFCKSIDAFKCLAPSDQLPILKAFYPESSAVYGAYIYNIEQDGLLVAVNEMDEKTIFVKLDISPDIKRKENAVTFRNFVLPMNAAMENDETIRDLIIAQLLFKPRANTSCVEFIKYNHSVYAHLLKKYLHCQYRSSADRMLSTLECALTDIESASEVFRDVFVHELALCQVKQILVEMFDLK